MISGIKTLIRFQEAKKEVNQLAHESTTDDCPAFGSVFEAVGEGAAPRIGVQGPNGGQVESAPQKLVWK